MEEVWQSIVGDGPFSSYAEFEKKLTEYERVVGCAFAKANASSVEYENKRRKQIIPTEYVYANCTFKCVHFGKPRTLSTGQRKSKRVLPLDCTARFKISFKSGALYVSKKCLEHKYHELVPISSNLPLAESGAQARRQQQKETKKAFKKKQTKAAKKSKLQDASTQTGLTEHSGSCHCGAVKFKVWAPENVDVFDCNCSICTKKQNFHFIVPKNNFVLLQGEDNITTYAFNKKLAKHTFCKTCGVQSFYTPRSNQDGIGVMPHCIDFGTIKSVNVKKFDGQNWEDSYAKSNISVYSKE
ncbi:centromere protein V [Biomphalaria pfeifferi]|uniref:Centromere protein V n=1 Tax=Biomphalaria pfeifferi TaxID=112525 RepID=A0AAD8BHN9_BIOPF|nr:centromere protein V [Biomphalaria pfeifferi]